jgi:hypothetical protein
MVPAPISKIRNRAIDQSSLLLDNSRETPGLASSKTGIGLQCNTSGFFWESLPEPGEKKGNPSVSWHGRPIRVGLSHEAKMSGKKKDRGFSKREEHGWTGKIP